MKKTVKFLLTLWVAVFVLSVLAFGIVVYAVKASDYADNATVKEYQKNIDKYESQMKELQKEIDAVKNERYGIQQKVSQIDELLTANENLRTATQALISEYEKQIAEKEENVTALEGEINILESDIADTREKFLTLIRVHYENGEPTMLEAIYDSNGLTDMLSRMEYVGSIMQYNSILLDGYSEKKTDLDGKVAVFEEQIASLNADVAEKSEYDGKLAAIEADLETQYGQQKALLSEIKAEENSLHDEYDKLSAAEEAESARLEKYLRQLAAQSKGEYVGGKLIWPVSTSVKRISSYYGWRTYYYRGRKITDFHRGIDIPAAIGTDIYAVQSGKVILSTSHSSYGKYCIIDHGGGITTLYAHCSELLVKEGDKVTQGQHIAEMGSTGQSTGSHLHFEVRVNGTHEDPIANGWLVQPK